MTESEKPINDGGPAFPIKERQEYSDGQTVCNEWPGMSLRDWFAGMALQGIKWNGYESLLASAQVCYTLADAMLEERAKTSNTPQSDAVSR